MLKICLALLSLFALLAPPALAEAPGGFVRVEGTRLVSPDGQTFAVKGINFGNWLIPEGYMFKFDRAKAPRQIYALVERLVGPEKAAAFWQSFRDNYITEDDIRFIKAAGFNTVRVPLHYALFVDPDDPTTFDGPGYALLDRVIGWCREAGLKVLIDLHAAPGGQTGVNHDDGNGYPMVFYVPSYRRQTIALWQHLAERYRDDPTVLGYDLLNEPISPYNDMDYLNPRLEPLYRDIVAAIRSVDGNHPVFLAAAQWSLNFGVFGPPFDDQAVYSYHKFWASTERDSVQDYVNYSNRYRVPLFLGETGELTDPWNQAFRELNEKFGIGWSFWTYKNLDSRSTVASIVRPEGWDAIAAAGALSPDEWNSATLPPPDEAEATLAAYLEAIKLHNVRINAGYLASLGMALPPGSPPVAAVAGPDPE